jgi:hypothetical protein
MPRTCSICSHPECQALNEALFRNKIPFRNVSKQYQVTVSALFRHAKHTREAEQQVLRSAEKLAASLPPKKQAYLEGRLAGKSKRQSALEAGFSQSMADHASTKIETSDVREAFAALIRQRVPPERLAKAIADGLDAMETKFFAEKGVVKDQRDVISWTERRQYAELAAKFAGYYAPDKREVEQPGGVILIIPDGPRTAATPAKPTLEGTVIDNTENGGPILVLPKGPGADANG